MPTEEEQARERGCVVFSHPKKETHFLIWNKVGRDWYLQKGGALNPGRQRGRRAYNEKEPKLYAVRNFTNTIRQYARLGYSAQS